MSGQRGTSPGVFAGGTPTRESGQVFTSSLTGRACVLRTIGVAVCRFYVPGTAV